MFKVLLVNLLKPFCYLLFDKKYFKGRWFDNDLTGWVWLIRALWFQKILGFNRHIPFPLNPSSKISNPKNIEFHSDNLDNFQSFGCYYQNFDAKIILKKNVYVAPNVGIITSNHDTNDLTKSLPGKEIVIGENCWLGFGSIILPGVNLAPKTIVAAGAVVTKSEPQGNCLLAGAPAVVVKRY